jgi:hypothetical protein
VEFAWAAAASLEDSLLSLPWNLLMLLILRRLRDLKPPAMPRPPGPQDAPPNLSREPTTLSGPGSARKSRFGDYLLGLQTMALSVSRDEQQPLIAIELAKKWMGIGMLAQVL